ncbi:MAG: TrpR-like protein, YerC/YecD [Oscillospiraceae bacterium]|nr:TrpR-like protein, YerC/YecD [Oscillospiraceae bacterium]
MNAKIKDMDLSLLLNSVLKLESYEECQNFFDDLCTVQELKALSQRIEVASMLIDGKVYSEIVKATGASTATISRVNRSLNYGSDGYRVIFDRLKEDGLL